MKKFILAVLMGLVVSQANAFSAAGHSAGHSVAAHTSVAPHVTVVAPKPATPPVKSVVVPPVRPVVTPIVLPHVSNVKAKKCGEKEKDCK